MKKFIREFKDFAVKGNMIDMVVAVVIGTAFNAVVSTLVKKVIMPPLSLLTEDVTLSNRKYVLREASDKVEEVAIGWGELLEVMVDFVIIAFTIFVVIKGMNRFKSRAEDPKDKEVVTPKDIELLSNIERLMEEQNELLKNK
ncbi:MAG: large conductance mechanosensitive channel protein MscL [Bacteroidia bacterium]|nr:large conductance mechanosensitive channel protein MscL [Bacteroidia bacterium]NNF29750.1 large conductance mechanosensitive channel protein MscL [Flavobacteriaceae bacterium]NNJ81603.1 large conductance mechanosensitive channel protein MscL [Flavobacteriaceae bacterium]NNM09225.1 large conductance mechanosensitive channel protein MscL [Flavobacteriaceae bacterium]